MPTPYFGINATKENNPELGERVVRGAALAGDVVVFTDQYTLLGTEAATEEIYIHRNRSGLRLIPHLSAVIAENPGTTLVMDIGDDEDTDKYADGLDVSAGGTFLFSAAPGVHQQDPIWTTDTGEQGDWVKVTIASASSLTAGQKIRFELVYAANS